MKPLKYAIFFFLFSFASIHAQIDEEYGIASDSTESNYKNKGKFNGPNSIIEQLKRDNQKRKSYFRLPIKVMKPWYDWKEGILEGTGIEFGMDYIGLYLKSSEVIDETIHDKITSSGVFDFNFSWNILNRKKGVNPGTLSFKLSDRHRYNGESSPMFHGLDESGYYGLTGTSYQDYTFRIIELHYSQEFFKGRLATIIGKIDPSNYFNFHGMGIPSKSFLNFGSIASGTVNTHNPGFGVGFGIELTKSLYFKMAFTDVYGDLYKDGEVLDFGQNFFNGDIQTWAEIGWAPTIDERFFKNFSLTFWRSPDYISHTGASIENDAGLAFSSHWFFKKKFMPFFRFGISGGKSENVFYKKDIQIGNGFYFKSHDLVGIAFSWAEPNIPGSKDQLTGELFYRAQITKHLAITPDLQWILNPTLNPDVTNLWYFGVRSRISL